MASVDLSSLNRAALAAKEGYGWIHVLALAYCVIIGLFSVGAWLADEQPFRAAVCAGAQTLSVIMALLARRGFTGQMFLPGLACVVIAFGFSTWAAEGLAHAWSANGAEIEEWQVWFLTGSEPAIFLLIEHIKEGREALRKAQAKADQEEADALAAARARDAASRPRPVEPPVERPPPVEQPAVARLKLVERPAEPVETTGAVDFSRAATAATGGLLLSTGQAAALPVEAVDLQLPRPEAIAHSERTFASAEDHARHLITNEGFRSRNALSRATGTRPDGRPKLSTHRAAQLLDELAPGWRTKRPAAA